MILSLWSKLFQKAWTAQSVIDNDLDTIGNSYVYCQNLFAAATAGNKPAIEALPHWLHVILNLLKPHSPKFRINTLKYQWNVPYAPELDTSATVQIAGKQYQFPIGYPDVSQSSGYIQPIIPATISSDALTNGVGFQAMMGLFRNGALPDTDLVSWGTVTYGLEDPSVFARSFNYLGSSSDTPGGSYGECELETNYLKSWIPAQFCPYADADVRVSRCFHHKSGDSSLLMTLPFLPGLHMADYRNPAPVIYKYIDFEEIYSWIIQWLVASLAQVMKNAASTELVTAPLDMSSQTFRIVLRQALLQIFSEQATVQFMTQRPAASSTDNVFVPFVLNSGTYSSPSFSQVKYPQILIENLRMLKTTVRKNPGSKAKLVYLPVLGRWWNDEYNSDPDLAENTAWNQPARSTKLFALDPSAETNIDLIDGNAGTVVINMNSEYYQTAAAAISTYFSNLVAAGGVLSTCGGDTGPGFSLLHLTKYVSTFSATHVATDPFAIMKQHVLEVTRSKSKGKLVSQPVRIAEKKSGPVTTVVGSVANNYVSSVSSSVPLSQDLQLLVTRFIVPVIRASVVAPGIQQESEWQIAYVEPYRIDTSTGAVGTGNTLSIAANIAAASLAPITAITSGANSDELVGVMKHLAETGKAANWGALLSGALQFGGAIADAVLG